MELGVTGKEPCREATLGGRAGVKEKVRCGGGPDNGQESSVRGEEMGSRSLSCARRAMRMEGIWDLARERAVGRQPAIAPVAGRCDVAGGARRGSLVLKIEREERGGSSEQGWGSGNSLAA